MANTIEFVRGDTHFVRLMLRSGSIPLLLASNDTGLLRVFDGGRLILAKEFSSADQTTDEQSENYGLISMAFSPADTEGLFPESSGGCAYLSYEIELRAANGVVSTPLTDQDFILRLDRIKPDEEEAQ